jgi:hypothetical protein
VESTPKEDAVPQSGTLGLAAFCSYAAGDAGKGCFTCKPRELPSTLCVAVPASFDPAAKCEHDLDRLTCDVGGEDEFVIEFGDKTPDEEMLESMPIVVFAAKALLTKKLDGKPELKAMVFKLLDSVADHAGAFFRGEDVSAVVDDARPLIKAAKPDLTDEQVAGIKKSLQEGVAAFAKKRASGPVNYADTFEVVAAAYAALPKDLFDGVKLDGKALPDFLAAIKSKSDADLLALLAETLGGEEAFGEIMGDIGIVPTAAP